MEKLSNMTAQILNGKEIAKGIRESLREELSKEKEAFGSDLKLVTIQIGDFEDAKLYAQAIARLMERFGIKHDAQVWSEDIACQAAQQKILELSQDPATTGILLLSPIPKDLDYQELVEAIPPAKDAEGTRYTSEEGADQVFPPTAMAVLELILASGIEIKGKETVVIGRSRIVGRPAAELLLQHHATVTICHTRTQDIAAHVRRADIVVAAAGKAKLIPGEWIKPGAVVIDSGENVVEGKLLGDVDFETAKERAGFITPVPSGVGPITSLMLVKNLLSLSRQARKARH